MNNKNILIAIKNKDWANQLKGLLELEGYQVFDTHRLDMAETLLRSHLFIGMLIERSFEKLEALQLHAAIYVRDKEVELFHQKRGLIESAALAALLKTDSLLQGIVEDAFNQSLLEQAEKAAKSHANILITGESGTGKEVLAQWIESHSERRSKAFIKINCAAIPDALLESELFGHEKGAFTGAIERRVGRFEAAHRGTLLLDEISEMPLHLQAKLLRVLQEREFERIGSNEPISVDVRIIATSNRNLEEAVQKKLFREDLYFRLHVVHFELPPLRNRKEVILKLAHYFLQKHSERHGKNPPLITEDQMKLLVLRSWRGNIRELSNVIERWVVLEELEVKKAEEAPFTVIPLSLFEMEKNHILQTLRFHCGDREKTAEILGITTRTLRTKLKAYQEQHPEFSELI